MDELDTVLSPAAWTLPEFLRCEGVSPAGFLPSSGFSRRHGASQGFDVHRDYMDLRREFDAEVVLADAARWIDQTDDERFVVFLSLPQLTFTWRREFDYAAVRLRYADELRRLDHGLANLRQRIRDHGADESTILIVMGYTAPYLGENGLYGRGPDEEPEDRPSSPLIVSAADLELPAVVRLEEVGSMLLESLGIERVDGHRFGDDTGTRFPRIVHPQSREECQLLCPGNCDCGDVPEFAGKPQVPRSGGRLGAHSPCN